jgi:hypothetical protein
LFDSKIKGFTDFKDYNVIDVLDDDKELEIERDKKYIFIMSAELFKMPDFYLSLTDYTKGKDLNDKELVKKLKENLKNQKNPKVL